jgi:hypothetical protein
VSVARTPAAAPALAATAEPEGPVGRAVEAAAAAVAHLLQLDSSDMRHASAEERRSAAHDRRLQRTAAISSAAAALHAVRRELAAVVANGRVSGALEEKLRQLTAATRQADEAELARGGGNDGNRDAQALSFRYCDAEETARALQCALLCAREALASGVPCPPDILEQVQRCEDVSDMPLTAWSWIRGFLAKKVAPAILQRLAFHECALSRVPAGAVDAEARARMGAAVQDVAYLRGVLEQVEHTRAAVLRLGPTTASAGVAGKLASWAADTFHELRGSQTELALLAASLQTTQAAWERGERVRAADAVEAEEEEEEAEEEPEYDDLGDPITPLRPSSDQRWAAEGPLQEAIAAMAGRGSGAADFSSPDPVFSPGLKQVDLRRCMPTPPPSRRYSLPRSSEVKKRDADIRAGVAVPELPLALDRACDMAALLGDAIVRLDGALEHPHPGLLVSPQVLRRAADELSRALALAGRAEAHALLMQRLLGRYQAAAHVRTARLAVRELSAAAARDGTLPVLPAPTTEKGAGLATCLVAALEADNARELAALSSLPETILHAEFTLSQPPHLAGVFHEYAEQLRALATRTGVALTTGLGGRSDAGGRRPAAAGPGVAEAAAVPGVAATASGELGQAGEDSPLGQAEVLARWLLSDSALDVVVRQHCAELQAAVSCQIAELPDDVQAAVAAAADWAAEAEAEDGASGWPHAAVAAADQTAAAAPKTPAAAPKTPAPLTWAAVPAAGEASATLPQGRTRALATQRPSPATPAAPAYLLPNPHVATPAAPAYLLPNPHVATPAAPAYLLLNPHVASPGLSLGRGLRKALSPVAVAVAADMRAPNPRGAASGRRPAAAGAAAASPLAAFLPAAAAAAGAAVEGSAAPVAGAEWAAPSASAAAGAGVELIDDPAATQALRERGALLVRMAHLLFVAAPAKPKRGGAAASAAAMLARAFIPNGHLPAQQGVTWPGPAALAGLRGHMDIVDSLCSMLDATRVRLKAATPAGLPADLVACLVASVRLETTLQQKIVAALELCVCAAGAAATDADVGAAVRALLCLHHANKGTAFIRRRCVAALGVHLHAAPRWKVVASAVADWLSAAPDGAPKHLAAAVLGEALLMGAVRGEALDGEKDAPIAVWAASLHSDGLTGAADKEPDFPATPRPASRPLALAIAACGDTAQLHTLYGLLKGKDKNADRFNKGSCPALFNARAMSTTLTAAGVAVVTRAVPAPDPSDDPSFLELAVLGAGPLTGPLKRDKALVGALGACGGDLDLVRTALAPGGAGAAPSPAEQLREAALLGTALQLLARRRTMAADCLTAVQAKPAPVGKSAAATKSTAPDAATRAAGNPPKKPAASRLTGTAAAGAGGMTATAPARGGAGSRP